MKTTPETKNSKREKEPEKGLLFSYKNFSFRLPNETKNVINIDVMPSPFDENANDLMAAMQKVKSQNIFGNVRLADLASNYAFVPFDYQYENVETMLNRFNGKGVFGDQVGLGKTTQALMCAHAMFASGAIRNALIVLPTNLQKCWKDEINRKFPKVFSVCTTEQDNLLSVLEKIDRDNATPLAGNEGFRLYFVTDTQIKQQWQAISNARTQAATKRLNAENAAAQAALGPMEETESFIALEKQLRNALNEDFVDEYNPQQLVEQYLQENRLAELDPQPLIKLIESILDEYNTFNEIERDGCAENIAALKESLPLLERFDTETITIGDAPSSPLTKLFSIGDERLIDLLIVDEVHTFFTGEQKDKQSEEDEEKNFDEDLAESYRRKMQKEQKDTVRLLSDIEKKFCVLLSATPIRNSLYDVFDLLYIADKNRLGDDETEARSYFVRTICQLPDEDKHMLSKMIFDKDEGRRKNFFGLINNFFTRKRIHDVENDMAGAYKATFGDLDEKQQLFLTPFLGEFRDGAIVRTSELHHHQKGRSNRDSSNFAYNDCCDWMGAGIADENRRNHFLSAVDGTLMGAINDTPSAEKDDIAMKKETHPLVDWRRRKKSGYGIVLAETTVDDSVSSALLQTHFNKDSAKTEISNDLGYLKSALEERLSQKAKKGTSVGDDGLMQVCKDLLAELEPLRYLVSRENADPAPLVRFIDHLDAAYTKFTTKLLKTSPKQYFAYFRKKTSANQIATNTFSVTERLSDMRSLLRLSNQNGKVRHVHDVLICSDPKKDCTFAKLFEQENLSFRTDFRHELGDLLRSLEYDTVLCYVSRTEGRDAFEKLLLRKYIEKKQYRAVAKNDSVSTLEEKVSFEDFNRVAIVHKGLQAGVNLQQYRTFVFAQMDLGGERLLEPVDIEQWIGRIHRTGQVKNCRIITVLKTYMKWANKNPEPDFLKWYYEILNDAEGLDLYGNNTPDIAFMQPVIEDKLRQLFNEEIQLEEKQWQAIAKQLHLPSQKQLNNIKNNIEYYGFAELLELCYVFDKQDAQKDLKATVRRLIRSLAKMDGFRAHKK